MLERCCTRLFASLMLSLEDSSGMRGRERAGEESPARGVLPTVISPVGHMYSRKRAILRLAELLSAVKLAAVSACTVCRGVTREGPGVCQWGIVPKQYTSVRRKMPVVRWQCLMHRICESTMGTVWVWVDVSSRACSVQSRDMGHVHNQVYRYVLCIRS